MITKEIINQKNPMSHEAVKKAKEDLYQQGYRAGIKYGFNMAKQIYFHETFQIENY